MTSNNSAAAVPFWSSCRFSVAVIGFVGYFIMASMRVNMSVAIVCMVNHTAVLADDDQHTIVGSNISYDNGGCRGDNITGVQEDGLFVWDKHIQGLTLGSFFWGYVVTQLPGGWLSNRFGGKRVFGYCMLLSSLATLLCPVSARISPYVLVALRVFIGLAQGTLWPATHQLLAQWSPPLERSKLAGFNYAGYSLGPAVAFPFYAFLCEHDIGGGWPSIFYVSGGAGVVWFAAWMYIVYDSPSLHPRISQCEREYIQHSLKGHVEANNNDKHSIPWRDIIKSPALLAICIAHFCQNWGSFTFLTNIPSYLREVLKFDIQLNGLLSAVPYIGIYVMMIPGAVIADSLRTSGVLGTTATRKLFNTLGQIVPACMCIGMGYITCSMPIAGVILFATGMSFSGLAEGSGFMVNHLDIAPRYAGILLAITNNIAALPGFAATFIISAVTQHQTQEEWRIVFYICGAIYTFGACVFLMFGSGELQDWARVKNNQPKCEKYADSNDKEIYFNLRNKDTIIAAGRDKSNDTDPAVSVTNYDYTYF